MLTGRAHMVSGEVLDRLGLDSCTCVLDLLRHAVMLMVGALNCCRLSGLQALPAPPGSSSSIPELPAYSPAQKSDGGRAPGRTPLPAWVVLPKRPLTDRQWACTARAVLIAAPVRCCPNRILDCTHA